ncbi:hypothetical protein FRAHR75_120125 [Frankia sp. Hr75.2]|nr:hypothetical protein FRAHR75_120125 [Frankia sp. Hr75.2]
MAGGGEQPTRAPAGRMVPDLSAIPAGSAAVDAEDNRDLTSNYRATDQAITRDFRDITR